MKIGQMQVSMLRDGTIRMDGGAFFGVVPRVLWERLIPPDEKNRVELNLNCPLIRASGKTILFDTGVGTKHPAKRQSIYGMDAGHLVDQVRGTGLEPEDIDYVVFSHLHFDHAGGATYWTPSGDLKTTFPRAQYLAQRADWEEASHPNERNRAGYYEEDLDPLLKANQLELLVGDTEIVPGVWCKLTGGHTAGHQIALLDVDGQKICFFGDLIPTVAHLPLPYSQGFDLYPLDVLNVKRELLALAEQERWLVLFDHELANPVGHLERSQDGKSLKVRPVEL